MDRSVYGRFIRAVLLVVTMVVTSYGQSSCSGTNDNNDQQCQISCPTGQAAECSNGVGSNPPSCRCSIGELFSPFAKSTLVDGKPVIKVFSASQVEAIDPSPVINSKLAKLRDYHLTNVCHPEEYRTCDYFLSSDPGNQARERRPCRIAYRQVCAPGIGKLSLGGPLSASKDPTVTAGKPDWRNIPSDIFVGHNAYNNCSEVAQSRSFTHAQTFSIGQVITKTKTIQTGASLSVTIKASVGVVLAGVEASTTISVNTSTQMQDSAQDNQTKQTTQTEAVPLTVPPMSHIDLSHSFILYNVPIPFTGSVVLDGPIAPNMEGVTMLSQIIPDELERTFSFSGVVNDSTFIDTATRVTEKKLTTADCQALQISH